MSKRPVSLLLADMMEAIEKIQLYIGALSEIEFKADSRTIDAVVRNLEILGEVANRMPEEFCDKNPHVEWAKMAGLRNRIIHGYFGVDINLIWQIIQKDLPVLKDSISLLHG